MSNLSVKATTHQNLTNNMLENTEAVQEIIIIIIMDRFMKLMRLISDAQLLKYSHQRKNNDMSAYLTNVANLHTIANVKM